MVRVIKMVALALASLLFLLLCAVGALLVVLHTNWGGDKLLHLALPRVNAGLTGKLEAQHLRLSWSEITLEGVRLRDPEARMVAQVMRLQVRWAPLELLHKHIDIGEVILQGPELLFRQEASGESNLRRALSGRTPKKQEAPSTKSSHGTSWRVDLGRLAISNGTVDLRLPGEGATSHWRAHEVNAQIQGRYDGGFNLQAQVRAAVSAPREAPLRVHLAAQGGLAPLGLSVDADGEVRWGKNGFRFSGKASQDGNTSAQVRIDELRVEPTLVQVFAPNLPLRAAVVGSGDLGWNGDAGQFLADLDLAVGGAKVTLKTTLQPTPLAVRSLALRVRSLDLAQVIQDGPPSKLDVRLEGHAQGQDLETLIASADLQVPAGLLGGFRLGPIRVRAEADRGNYQVRELTAVLPGMNLSGSGQSNRHTVQAHGLIDVSDLGKTVAAVMAGSKGPKAHASGRGRILISAAGPVKGPGLHAAGRLSGLTFQELDIPEIRFAIDVPNLAKPLASDLSLFAERIGYGTRHLQGVKAIYRASGPRFAAKLSAQPFDTSLLEMAGTWNRTHTGLTLNKGRLRLQHARWDLAAPTRLSFGQNAWQVSGLDLQGPGEQRLRLEAARKGRDMHADLWISQLGLALLPAQILPAPLKPAGQVDAEIHVRGRVSDPVADARLALVHAEIDGLADISFVSNAHLLARRISGDLRLEGGGAHLSGRFDLPAAWPLPAASPLSLDLTALDLDLQLIADKLARAQVKLPRLAGLACMKVLLQGTAAHPDLALDLRLRELQVAGSPMGNLTFQGTAHDGKPMTALLAINPIGPQTGRGQVSVQAGLGLNELMWPRFSPQKLKTAALRANAHLEHIALAPVMALAGNPRKWSGEADVEGSWQGTGTGGQGKLRVTGQGITVDRYPPTEVVLDAETGGREQQVHARVSRKGANLLLLDLGLQAPLSRLQNPNWPELPVRVHALLGPLDVKRDGLTPDSFREPSRVLQARVQALVEVTGTLGRPRLQAHARMDDIRMDQKPLGHIDVVLSYADQRAKGNLDMVSTDGGRWQSEAVLLADLGYPAVMHGLGQAELKAHAQANGFNVTGFSGLTPRLRTLAGRVIADVSVTGTLSDPRPSGRFEWKDGELTIIGLGEYRKIHLLAQGDRDFITLDELKLESGSGKARVTGKGQHRAQGGYDIDADIGVDKLPLYSEGQRLATLSLEAKAQSQVSAQHNQTQVNVRSARVALSDAKKKDLQKLARPDNVVLVENGVPVNAEQKRKLDKVDVQLGLAKKSARPAMAPKGPKTVVAVNAPRDLWISGEDANLELSLRPGFRIEINDETQIFGTVEIRRGLVSLLGQRFDLKEGSTLVFGGPPDKPELDVTAKYNDWEDNIVVEITAKGPPDKLQIGIRAPDRPDLTESQLYTLVVTGHLTVGGNTSSTSSRGDQAASLLGGVVAGELQKVLAKKLPIDVLTIQTGSELGSARVEAGTYVTRSLYVGYVSRLGPTDPALLQNRNAVRLEYDLTTRWSFQGEYGDAMNGSADVLWTKHY